MDAIYAKYDPLITFAESRLRPDEILSVRQAYEARPEYIGLGTSNATNLNNMYYLRDCELTAARPKPTVWPVVVCVGAFALAAHLLHR